MTNEPSPRPWRAEQNVVGWTSFIVDANGDGVAACWRTARGDDEKERQYNEANAALIVAAVNERDDLLREMNGVREAARKVVADWQTALDERDNLKAERDRLKAAHADLWRAVKRIEADSSLGLWKGLEVASSALHLVHAYASSAIRAAEKKGFAPATWEDAK